LVGGITWDSIQAFGHSIVSLNFVNDSIGYAVGQGGKIYKITNANTVGINQIPLSNNISSSVSPNPFIESTTLQVSHTGSKLVIYDSMGSIVREQIINTQTTIINRNSLPTGIYIYQVVQQSGQFLTGKFIIE
jgi:hypothetical protein